MAQEAKRFGVDMMIHRIATAELYRDNPTSVRCRWSFRDFIEAHIVLDVADAERSRRESDAG